MAFMLCDYSGPQAGLSGEYSTVAISVTMKSSRWFKEWKASETPLWQLR